MKAVAFAIVLLALAGCSDSTPPVASAPNQSAKPAADAALQASQLPAISHSSTVDFAIGDESQKLAMPLLGDSRVKATVVSNSGGELVGVGILIGNYGGKSRGGVDLEVCHAAECRKAGIDTLFTVDNQILAFPVESALPIDKGSELKLTLTRQAGRNEFAIWTFPDTDKATELVSSDPAFQNRVARIQLLLK